MRGKPPLGWRVVRTTMGPTNIVRREVGPMSFEIWSQEPGNRLSVISARVAVSDTSIRRR